MQNPASRVFHDHKDVEEAKGRGDHHAEVTGDECLGMIADKGPPALGWSVFPPAAIQVLGQVLPTVRGDTRRPSFSKSSLAIRFHPMLDSHRPSDG